VIRGLLALVLRERAAVLLLALLLAGAGAMSLRQLPMDALPDLSEVQVIVKAQLPGQSPRDVEDQLTYPLSAALLAVPGVQDLRAFSFFGDAFLYAIFEEGTDPYWARSRVAEALAEAQGQLPAGATASLGPDASALGWVLAYALIDRSGQNDLPTLRRFQEEFLRYELQGLPGVAEVAVLGGREDLLEVIADPERLATHGISLTTLLDAVRSASSEQGASLMELGEREFLLRADGSLADPLALGALPLRTDPNQGSVRVRDVAEVRIGTRARRGIAELNGEGEVVGAFVIMRQGADVMNTITAVKDRLGALESSLPQGAEIVITYDRSALIEQSVATLWDVLGKELLIVTALLAVCLRRLRPLLVTLVSIPLGFLATFLLLRAQGLTLNVMALGGLAIAIGAMVDAAIVLIDSAQRRLDALGPGASPRARWEAVAATAHALGPTLFTSMAIITLSFLPIFALEGQEGRLFGPLAATKTWAMAASAVLCVTVLPVLLGLFLRPGRSTKAREAHRSSTFAKPLDALLRRPALAAFLTAALSLSALYPSLALESEFLPPFNEGDLLYMPTVDPGLAPGAAARLLQQTDRLLKQVPEVAQVFAKAGRAATATDPAPLSMFEAVIQLTPEDSWAPGRDRRAIERDLQAQVAMVGLSNAWTQPIRARIDMLSTGMQAPLGLKFSGPELETLAELSQQAAARLAPLAGPEAVYAERSVSGRYLTLTLKPEAAARYGVTSQGFTQLLAELVGGRTLGTVIDGRQRTRLRVRLDDAYRSSPEALGALPLTLPSGLTVRLDEVATLRLERGPAMIKSENAQPQSWVFLYPGEMGVSAFKEQAEARLSDLALPPGYSWRWSGRFAEWDRAKARLLQLGGVTILLIALLLWLQSHRLQTVLLTLVTLPPACSGALWLSWSLGHKWSVALVVGLLALAGLAAEMALLLLSALNAAPEQSLCPKAQAATAAASRLRAVIMTSGSTILALAPIMLSEGAGADLMQRIAAPMLGGLLTTVPTVLLLIPALWCLGQRGTDGRSYHRHEHNQLDA